MAEASPSPGGFSIVPNWIIRKSNLTKNELLVYIALLNRADGHGFAFPSIPLIAHDARVSERTVQTTLKSLQLRGIVTKKVRPRGDGTNESNMYQVAVFDRAEPVGRSEFISPPVSRDTGDRELSPVVFLDTSDGEPDTWCNPDTPLVQPLRHPGAVVAGEEDPLEEDPIEEDIRSTLTSGRASSSFRFIDNNNKATTKQLAFLHDLHIHYNSEKPSAKRTAEWAALSMADATILIKRFLAAMPRYDQYQGPEAGEDAYEALSARGREAAELGMIPA